MIFRSLPLFVAVILALGCQPSASKSATESAGGATSPARTVKPGDVGPPPGVAAELVLPRTGESLQRAHTPWTQIHAQLPPLPAFRLAPAATEPAEDDQVQPPAEIADEEEDVENQTIVVAPDEPPLAAQHAFIEGRNALLQGRRFEAITQLQIANELAPNQPEILRMLGQIYAMSGNASRAAVYLEQALALDHTDAESAFLLGRYMFEQSNWQAALQYLTHALQMTNEQSDAAMQPLVHYFIASALEREGYDRAAIEQYEQYLQHLPARFQRTTRLVREVAFLYRQRPTSAVLMGDAYNRLADPKAALAQYTKVIEFGAGEQPLWAGRVAYTFLRLGRQEEAEATVIAYIQSIGADANSLPLISYLVEQGVPARRFAARLNVLYESLGQPSDLALAMADMLEPAKARQILRTHLLAKPRDRVVFERLLRMAFEQGTREAVVETVQITFSSVQAQPAIMQSYFTSLIDAAGDGQLLHNTLDTLPEAQLRQPLVHLLRGLIFKRQNNTAGAIEQFELARAADPQLQLAVTELVKLLIVGQQVQRAEGLLQPLEAGGDPEVNRLKAIIMAQTGRREQAMQLLKQTIAQHPTEFEPVLTMAELHLHAREIVEAERLVWEALRLRPDVEQLYVFLINLYDQPDAPPDAVRQRDRLIQQVRQMIPQSRTARIMRAREHAQHGENLSAEQLLRNLLTENAQDWQVLRGLLDVLVRSQRREQAIELIEKYLAQMPDNLAVLQIALDFYQKTEPNEPRTLELLERVLKLEPANVQLAIMLSARYLQLKQHEKSAQIAINLLAREELTQLPEPLFHIIGRSLLQTNEPDRLKQQYEFALQKFPALIDELSYQYSFFMQCFGNNEGAEQLMLQILQRDPNHVPANNGLGYLWLSHDRNLEEAKRLIQIAVEQEPDIAAYLDSMGWAHYKLGDFDEALKWLDRAQRGIGGTHPVIMDHLGDTLYRTGEPERAMIVWQTAEQLMSQLLDEVDPELEDLEHRLRDKINAVSRKEEPKIARSPGAEAKAAQDVKAADENGAAPQVEPPVDPAAEPLQQHGDDAAANPVVPQDENR